MIIKVLKKATALTSIFFFLFCTNLFAQNKVLDKILAVIDDQVITYSEVNRIISTVAVRNKISPQIYANESLLSNEATNIIIGIGLVRAHLTSIGYEINDRQVEEQIQSIESRYNLTRDKLYAFLNSNHITFEEYFELIRATIERNIFQSRVIMPMVAITEQQIKNTFFKKHDQFKTLAFKYQLINFIIDANSISHLQVQQLPQVLKQYSTNGVLPTEYKKLENYDLGEITEEGLAPEIVQTLKSTDEGAYSNPIKIDHKYHVFFVKKKDLVESSAYLQNKDRIHEELLTQEMAKMFDSWLEREEQKHFIKKFL